MQPIFLIVGTPACGKSTVSRALARRFELRVHIPVDDLRHMVVGGLSDMNFGNEDKLHELSPDTLKWCLKHLTCLKRWGCRTGWGPSTGPESLG